MTMVTILLLLLLLLVMMVMMKNEQMRSCSKVRGVNVKGSEQLASGSKVVLLMGIEEDGR